MVRKATRAIVRGGKAILSRRFDAWVLHVSNVKSDVAEEGWALRVGRHILRCVRTDIKTLTFEHFATDPEP